MINIINKIKLLKRSHTPWGYHIVHMVQWYTCMVQWLYSTVQYSGTVECGTLSNNWMCVPHNVHMMIAIGFNYWVYYTTTYHIQYCTIYCTGSPNFNCVKSCWQSTYMYMNTICVWVWCINTDCGPEVWEWTAHFVHVSTTATQTVM